MFHSLLFFGLSFKYKGFIYLDINISQIYISSCHIPWIWFLFCLITIIISFTIHSCILNLTLNISIRSRVTFVASHLSLNHPTVSTILLSIDNRLKLPIATTPLHLSSSNHHPMLTRSKINHSKPKMFLVYSSTTTIPSSYKEVLAHSWRCFLKNDCTWYHLLNHVLLFP